MMKLSTPQMAQMMMLIADKLPAIRQSIEPGMGLEGGGRIGNARDTALPPGVSNLIGGRDVPRYILNPTADAMPKAQARVAEIMAKGQNGGKITAQEAEELRGLQTAIYNLHTRGSWGE